MADRYGDLPFDEAIQFFQKKKLVPTERWSDLWRTQHNSAFMVAGAMQADLVSDFHKAVDQVIAGGATLASFRKDFDKIVARYGWGYNGGRNWRTRVIYDTNLRQAYNAGREAQMADPALQKRRPYGLYRHRDSAHPRPHHQAWDGLAIPLDDPWWETHTPQNGWGCRCQKFMVSDRDLKRMGKSGPDSAPGIERREWVDKSTGETHQVPVGIDPGFDYRPIPGQEGRQKQTVDRKASTLPKPIGTELNKKVDNIPPPPPLPTTAQTGARSVPAWSSVDGVTQAALDAVFDQLPAEQLEKVRRFLTAHPQKAVFLKQAEMGFKNKAARDAREPIGDFLGTGANRHYYAVGRPTRTNGWTSNRFEHVVVKAKATDNIGKTLIDDLAAAVELAIDNRLDQGTMRWSMRAALDEVTAGKRPGIFSTFIHELGHQIHYWGGAPARPKDMPYYITKYSGANKHEFHAEHFTAWLFNYKALKRSSPALAKYFDGLIEKAIKSEVKSR